MTRIEAHYHCREAFEAYLDMAEEFERRAGMNGDTTSLLDTISARRRAWSQWKRQCAEMGFDPEDEVICLWLSNNEIPDTNA